MSEARLPDIAAVEVNQRLPVVRVPLNATNIMATALATRDYQPVHHDLERARSLGAASVYSNTHTAAGWLERLVLEWAGPRAFLRSLKLKLGVPNHPGDELLLEGKVTAVDRSSGRVTVAVVGRNARGDHVTGEVVVQLEWAAHA